MRWTLRLELMDDDGAKREAEVFVIERAKLITEAEVGLAHREAKTLLLRLQQHLVAQQIAAHGEAKRACEHCGARCWLRDYKTRVIDTVFGKVKVRSARYERCPCIRPAPTKTVSPIARLLPRRCTPELAVMRACLGRADCLTAKRPG